MPHDDISSPVQLQQRLPDDATLQHLGGAIAALPFAALIADRHGRYVAVNEAALRLTGFSEEQLLKKALPDLTGSPDAGVSEVLWRAFLDQKHQRGEFALQRHGGAHILVRYEALADVIPGYHVSFLRPVAE